VVSGIGHGAEAARAARRRERRFPFHPRAVKLVPVGEAGFDGHSVVPGRVVVMTPHEFVSKWRGVEYFCGLLCFCSLYVLKRFMSMQKAVR
jgi:hypothetical protein